MRRDAINSTAKMLHQELCSGHHAPFVDPMPQSGSGKPGHVDTGGGKPLTSLLHGIEWHDRVRVTVDQQDRRLGTDFAG